MRRQQAQPGLACFTKECTMPIASGRRTAMACRTLLRLRLLAVWACWCAVSAQGEPPAGFGALGSCLTEKSDWVVRGRDIVAKASAGRLVLSPEAEPAWTDAERARGYALFCRHYLDPVTVFSRPARSEIADRLVLFASPGEYEPATFALHAIGPLRGVTTSASDLTAPSGAVIASENVEVRTVRRLVCTRDGDRSRYYEWPLALERRAAAACPAGDNLGYWVTVYVPPDATPTVGASPGLAWPDRWDDPALTAAAYRGTITVTVPDRPDSRLDLVLIVLPIRLDEPERLYGMCYLPTPASRGTFPDSLDQDMVDMRAHGMNSIWTWPDSLTKEMPDGRIVYDFSRPMLFRKDYMVYGLDAVLEAYRRAGFTRFWVCGTLDPMKEIIADYLGYRLGSEGFDRAYLAYIEQLREHATRQGWPDYCLHPIDEPGDPARAREALHYYSLIKKAFPKERTFADFGPWKGEDKALIPACDIVCLAIPNPDNAGKVTAAGKELWAYNIGSFGHQPKLDRLTWGLTARKIGVKGYFQWVYQWWVEDSVAGGFPSCIRYTQPAPDGPLPTPAWEAVREGIDDERYLVTLEARIRRAGDDNPAAVAAREALAAILAPVPGGGTPVVGGGYRDAFLDRTPSVQFDLWRWTIAGHILRLPTD